VAHSPTSDQRSLHDQYSLLTLRTIAQRLHQANLVGATRSGPHEEEAEVEAGEDQAGQVPDEAGELAMRGQRQSVLQGRKRRSSA
jgi:hypothetical protein